MKIVIDGYEVVEPVTGVGRVIKAYVFWLVKILPEHEFILLTRQHSDKFPSHNLTQHVLLPDRGYFRWQNGPFMRKLKQVQPDVLIAFNYTLPLFCQVKSILFEHDISFVSHPEWFSLRDAVKRKHLTRRSLKKCEVVITHSEFTRREIQKHFSISSEKVKVISHGVEDIFRVVSSEEVERYKESKDLRGKIIVGFLGSIFNRRHIPELVEAVSLMRKETPELFLYIVGKDKTHPPQNIPRLLDEDWIRWEQEIPEGELPVFYNSLEAFAYLSEYEGFGLPPLEALACGTVPVLLNLSALKEVYQDLAVMVDSAEAEKIRAGLEVALTDTRKKDSLAERFNQTRARFSWEKSAQELAHWIGEVLHRD